MAGEASMKDWLDLYESGKHRRYSLLFAVNGGAFAIARLLVGEEGRGVVLGGLTLSALAIGMVLFTAVMAADIYLFGAKMRALLCRMGAMELFGAPGKIVLLLLALLIAGGWVMAGMLPPPAE